MTLGDLIRMLQAIAADHGEDVVVGLEPGPNGIAFTWQIGPDACPPTQ